MTAPTNLRSQVERDETTRAMFMKYSSQEARSAMVACMIQLSRAGRNADVPQLWGGRCARRGAVRLLQGAAADRSLPVVSRDDLCRREALLALRRTHLRRGERGRKRRRRRGRGDRGERACVSAVSRAADGD